jgi:hypothetical protein
VLIQVGKGGEVLIQVGKGGEVLIGAEESRGDGCARTKGREGGERERRDATRR